MTAQVRKLRAGEEEAFIHSVMTPFLDAVTGDADQKADIEREVATIEVDRSWVAEDDGRFVGNACNVSLDLSLPAAPGRPCPVIPMAGVSAVGVHPTHRRQGLLNKLMASMLADARERGEAIAALNASESIIYGRYGFGLASDMVTYGIDTRHSGFSRPAPNVPLRLVDGDEALKVLPETFERYRRLRPGEPSRDTLVWEHRLADPPGRRGGGSGLFIVVTDDGYVTYRRSGNGPDVFRAERAEVVVEELRGVTPEIEAALWRFVLDLDLVGRVVAGRRPVDEPLRWRLADPRQLQVLHVIDRLYLRVLDVAEALTARGYSSPGHLVLDVQAAPAGEAKDPAVGRWVLDAGPDGSTCRPAKRGDQPDLALDLTALGSLYLGAFPASVLAAGGAVVELTAGSLNQADALFASRPAALSATGF
jgi:predicted acetyltransferase